MYIYVIHGQIVGPISSFLQDWDRIKMEPEFTLPQEENDFYVTKNVQASFEKHG